MKVDALLRFSNAQALTVDAASTNTIDLTPGAERRIGDGEPMDVIIFCIVAAAGGGTLNIQLQSDDNSAFSSAAVVCETGALAAAKFTAGAVIVLAIPPGVNTEKFLRLNYDLTTMTGVTLTAYLTPRKLVSAGAVYPDAITITGP